MQFAAPAAWYWLLLAVPLAALYFLRVKPNRQTVSSLSFWDTAVPDRRPRRLWRNLRDPLALLLSLMLMFMLVAAKAQPVGRGWDDPPRTWGVIVDNSASMQALNRGQRRLSIALQTAEKMIRAMRPEDQMCLLTAGTTAVIHCGLSSHPRYLRDALETIGSTDGTDRLPEAVRLARGLDPDASMEIVVLTDGQGEQHLAAAGINDVAVNLSGPALSNLAITELQGRRVPTDPSIFEVLVELANFSTESAEFQLELTLDKQLLDVVPVVLEPGELWRQTRLFDREVGGVLRARLPDDDALAADNQASMLLDPLPTHRVVLATAGNVFLESVLQSQPTVDLEVVDRVPTEVADGTILVVDGLPATALPAGNQLLINVNQDVPWSVGERLTDVSVTYQADLPLMKHVDLRDLQVIGTRHIEFSDGVTVLAATDHDYPVYVLDKNPLGGDRLILNLDLLAGEVPLRIAFPILMRNAIHWLGGRWSSFHPAYRTGATAAVSDGSGRLEVAAAEENDRWWSLVDPDGNQQRLFAGESVSVGPFNRIGIWRLWDTMTPETDQPSHVGSLSFACNLANAQESDLRAQSRHDQWSSLPSRRDPWWMFLVGLALVVSAAEWALFHRRWLG